jgi:hypothetical protein
MKVRNRLFAISLSAVCLGAGLLATTAQATTPAWQPIGATGPTVIPAEQNEVQKLLVDADGGTFTLTARELAAEGIGDLNSTLVKNVITTNGSFAPGQRLEGYFLRPGTDILFGLPTIFLVSKPASEIQAQSPIAGYASPATTEPLPYNASAAEVQVALEGLPTVGPGNVEVSGGPGGPGAGAPYVIAFKGGLADTNVSLLETGNEALSGNAVTQTTVSGGPNTSTLMLMAVNVGAATSSGPVTLRAELPSGITALAPSTTNSFLPVAPWDCGGSTADEIVCTREEAVRTGLTLPPISTVIAPAPGVTGGTVHIEISGGGAAEPATRDLPLTVSTKLAEPGIQTFFAGAFDENGNYDQRAGGHPFNAATAIFVNTVRSVKGYVLPAGELKDIAVKLPPGFIGNPSAVPACPEETPTQNCNLDSVVGVTEPIVERFDKWSLPTLVYNTQAPIGYPAKFRFRILESEEVNVVGSLRSDEDYGITAVSPRTPQVSHVLGVFFTFWGRPASHTFDSVRCSARDAGLGLRDYTSIRFEEGCRASGSADTALLTSATNCSEQAANPPVTSIAATLWQVPDLTVEASAPIPPVTGCEDLELESGFSMQPSDSAADSPASFTTSLTMPDEGLLDPQKLMTPTLKDSVVTLPEGVVLNAAGADGLQACSLDQIGFMGKNFPMPNPIRFDRTPQTCPEASKIGTLDLKSALLEDPLHGALYLAAQGDGNPFGSLFALYLVIEDPRHGIFIKLPGRVDPDERTGQMKVSFANLPQLPFTSLDLKLKGGEHSALASPTTCGNFTSTAVNTPWSAPESKTPGSQNPIQTVPSSFQVDHGPNGLPCARTPEERPFNVGWSAGAKSVAAGADGPFVFDLTRPDGSQEIESLELATPPGLSASLKGIPYCSDAEIAAIGQKTGREELAHPGCPQASQVGNVLTAAGSGPAPFHTGGKLYLAGPYKGGPFSVVAVTPAVAGPFDLGNVVVRSAVRIDRTTAQVTAEADPIPQILKGVPLRVRDVRIELDRDNWTINPTSCDPSTVNVVVRGNSGAVARRSTRFQVGGCRDLPFGPKLRAHLTGGTKRAKHPAFTAEVTFPAGQANTKDVQVTIPHSEFLEQAHINTICTRVQAAAHDCPRGSIYGFAEAETPLIDGKLTGPVFLKSSDHQLPDLAVALRGPDNQPIEVEFSGRIDSVRGQIRNTIEGLPDVPVSRFVLRMKGGRKGLLTNSRNLCAAKTTRMTVRMVGHNNKVVQERPPLKRKCGKAKKGHGKHPARPVKKG